MRDAAEPAPEPHMQRALANAVARCYRRRSGRGPTYAQADSRADIVVVVLGGVLTLAERALVVAGRQDAVRQQRAAMHDTMGIELAVAIQRLTGCRVQAALSADDVDRDLAAEVFVLEGPATEPRCGWTSAARSHGRP